MKKLLYIGNHLSKTGNTETTIETLSKSLRLEGYRVFVSSKKSDRLFRLLDMLYAVLKYSKKVDYVLIDTYSTLNFQYAFFVSQLCRILNLKYIPILHGGNLPHRLMQNPKLCRLMFSKAYKNVSPSNYITSEFETHGYTNLVGIPNAIDINKYPLEVKDFKTIRLLWVRSFSQIYNPLLAVKILKNLKDEGLNASLCMVGPDKDGSLSDAKKYADSQAVTVKFTGKLSKKEWIKLSKDYNIFINTTNFDNMPVSVIEAMALGFPVVSTNVGGMPFLIANNKDGVLVNPDDIIGFVAAIKALHCDPDKVKKLSKNARKKAETYDWQQIKQQWLSLLS